MKDVFTPPPSIFRKGDPAMTAGVEKIAGKILWRDKYPPQKEGRFLTAGKNRPLIRKTLIQVKAISAIFCAAFHL
jgi:hypothetical protein